MTLDEAIKHAEDVVKENEEISLYTPVDFCGRAEIDRCTKCAEEHRQLAEWLKELKQLREQTKWIPVSERPPEENETVMASTEYGVFPEARYTKEYGWEWAYEAGSDYWRELEDVTAWMPLPSPYKPD